MELRTVRHGRARASRRLVERGRRLLRTGPLRSGEGEESAEMVAGRSEGGTNRRSRFGSRLDAGSCEWRGSASRLSAGKG